MWKTRFQHPTINLEINSPLTPQQDPDLQDKCEVRPTLKLWNVEASKANTHTHQKYINRCLRIILNIRWPEIVSNEKLWDNAIKTSPNREKNKGKGMGMDKSHATKACIKYGWSMDEEAKAAGMMWAELKRISRNCESYAGATQCSSRNKK